MKEPWGAIGWWEIRRIPYNLMLLLLGVATILVVELVGAHYARPGEDVEEPLGIIFGAVAYGVAANLFYTLGWVVELVFMGVVPVDTKRRLRTRLFWAGIILSGVLTVLPAILLPLLWAVFGFQHA